MHAQPGIDISRDGRLIVAAIEYEGTTWLYRRFLDEPGGEIVPGTEGAYHPRISPDGSRISFLAEDQLKRVDARGDRITPMVELANPFGQVWNGNQEVLVSRREAQELLRVDVQRSTTAAIIRPLRTERFYWPEPVPGMDAVLVNQSHVAKSDETAADPIYLDRLDGSDRVRLGVEGTQPRFFGDDLLLFVRDGALMAAPFSIDDLARQRTSRTVLDGLIVESSIGHYALSGEGTLVYAPGTWLVGKSLVWDDGKGNVTELDFPVLGYGDFELSPDGARLAITIGSANAAIWIYDLERGTRRKLLGETIGYNPTWSPDGTQIAFASTDGTDFSIQVVTVGSAAAPEVILSSANNISPYAWHPEAGLLCASWDQTNAIMRINPDQPGEPESLVASPASEWGPDVSPDGRWMAYTSDESGRYEIHVRSLGAESRSWPVSVDGGEEPIWASDGSAIFFRNGSQFMRTPVLEASEDGTRFRAGNPAVFVEGAYSNVPGLSYDVGPGDDRLLLLKTDGGTERPSHLNVILNFDEILEEEMSRN